MKRLIPALLLALFASTAGAQSLINCATSTPCANGGPQNTGTGDNLPTAGTKINANFLLLPSALFNGSPLLQANGGTGATSLSAAGVPVQSGSITSGHCATWLSSTTIGDAGAACGGGGGSTTFQSNGTGLTSSTTVNFENSAATNGLTLTFSNPSAGNVQLGLTGWPSLIGGDCLTNNGATLSWGSCGTGGSSTFNSLTSGTNTAATMVVGTGASLAVTGSGTISATNTTAVNGAAVPASAVVLGSNSSNQLTAASTSGSGGVVLATSPTIATPTISGNLTTNVTGSTQCVHANSAGVLSGTGSDCGAGGSTAFSALTAGTNTAAAMLVGTGSSLGVTGSGTITASAVPVGGVSGLGTGMATFLATPSTANLAATVTGETGTGALVFGTSPSLTTPTLTGSSTGLTTLASANASASNFTMTAPANTGTLAELNLAQSWSALQTFAASDISIAGQTITGATGTGSVVLATSPTLTTPNIGVATATTVNGSTVPTSAGTLPGSTGAFTTGHCLEVGGTAPLEIQDNGSACGTGGSTAFSALTGSTNTSAAMVVGTGASLAVSGTGTIAATNTTGVNGAAVPASAAVLASNVSNQITAATTTGTGSSVVLATSPTLVTPALGTPSSATLTNATGLPVSTGVSGLGTGVATFLATPSSANLLTAVTGETGTGALVFGTSPTLVTPALGTPASGVATNLTGLPISTGVSGLATGIATFLATPTSANLATAVTNETGSGLLVFGTSPTLVTPVLSGATGSTQCVQVNSSGVMAGSGAACGGSGAVSSVTAGSSGSVSVSPTTGAVIVDLASVATATVLGNVSGSSGAPTAVTMANLQAALVGANALLVSATAPTGPTNDYSPTGYGTTTAVLYLTPTSGGSTLDGLVAGSTMQQVFIVNAEAAGGTDNLILINQSSSDSTATNRFLAAGNLSIPPGGGVNCLYLPTVTRWWCH